MFRIGNSPDADPANSDRQKENQGKEFGSGFEPSIQNPEMPARNPADIPSTARAIPESDVLAREIKEGNLSGYVGHGTVIKGETSFKGMMRIDGFVGGKLTSDGGTIVVGDGGQVDADLDVAVATIRGIVNGDIIASQRVELGRTAKVRGNIHTASLAIDQGAFFEGACRMGPIVRQAETVKNDSRPAKKSEDYGAIAASLNAAVGDERSDAGSFTNIPDVTN
jgi:cytoskeletal protein CcmA (bactofilin family)